jgi:hypothetical protein
MPPMPERIQLRRTAGWRKPEGAVVVARPSRWGNPFKVGSTNWIPVGGGRWSKDPHPPLTREQAIECYRFCAEFDLEQDPWAFADLAGRDLACWCPLVDEEGQRVPCHADVLLELANPGWR